jgi:acetyl esterase
MLFARWFSIGLIASTMVSSGLAAEIRKDVEYARAEGMSLQLDASIPDGTGPFAAAVVVHGGGWVRGDRRIDVAPILPPLADADIAWFSISYRLATDPLHFGVAIDDVVAAVRFVRDHAAEYRIDPDRIALVGESAGGQLAAMAALSVPVKAVVGLYAPTDLVALLDGSGLIPAQIRRQFQGTPLEALLRGRLKQLSPVANVRRDMPPFLLIHGTADPLVPFDQSRAMCDTMTAAGASCEVFPVRGAGHGVRWWEGDRDMSEPYKQKMVRWLTAQLAARKVFAL